MKYQRLIFRVLDKLLSEDSRLQLRMSAILGLFLAYAPIGTLHWLGFILLALVVRTNLLVVFLSYAAFYPISQSLDPLSHWIGKRLLIDTESLHRMWAWLCHAPLIPYTEFNNTIVLGQFVTALVAAPLFFFFLHFFGPKMLDRFLTAFKRTNLWRRWVYTRIA